MNTPNVSSKGVSNSKFVETHLPCPLPNCGSSDGYSIASDGHGYCFSCQGYTPPSGKGEQQFTYEYLARRSISKETHSFYDVKTKIDASGKPVSVGYQYPNHSFKIRNFDKKEFYTEGDIGKAGLFGVDKFAAGSHKYVTITEGEDDALSLYEVLRSPVVSVQSASSAVRDVAACRSWLNQHERIYLAFDNDAPGREALAAVAKLFDYNKVFHVKFTNRKDANEYLAAGEGQQLRNIWWNSKKFLPETVISSFDEYKKILEEADPAGVPWPWPTLTDLTYGIRQGKSYLITAQEGVGKTEVMHAIEHKLLEETDDAIGAIFLEEPKKDHIKTLAAITLKQPVNRPDSTVGTGEVFAAFQKAVGSDDRLHIYSHFGSDDPEVLLDTIRFLVSARGCRYILLDHISMVVSGLQGEDERKALDYIATRLEMMVQELGFALIFVSHVNDMGQTRGSRYIGKIAHVRLDLTRDVMNEDPVVRNTIELSLSKNRGGKRAGPAGKIIYSNETATFHEEMFTAAANDNNLFPEKDKEDGKVLRAKAK